MTSTTNLAHQPESLTGGDGCSPRVTDADRVAATRARVLDRPSAEEVAGLFRLAHVRLLLDLSMEHVGHGLQP